MGKEKKWFEMKTIMPVTISFTILICFVYRLKNLYDILALEITERSEVSVGFFALLKDCMYMLPIPAIIAYTLLALALLVNVSSSYYYVEGRKKELVIRKICGASKSDINKLLLKQFMMNNILSLIPGIIILVIIEKSVSVLLLTIICALLIMINICCLLISIKVVRNERDYK